MAKSKTSKLDLLNAIGERSSVNDLEEKHVTKSEKVVSTTNQENPKPEEEPQLRPAITLNKLERELVKYKEESNASNRVTKSISIDQDIALDLEDILYKLKRKGHNIGFSLTVESLIRKLILEYTKTEQ